MQRKVVARYRDGRILKGSTEDFRPGSGRFTLLLEEGYRRGESVSVEMESLKALFFVKSLTGNPGHSERKLYAAQERSPGQRISVTFTDGETIRGTTSGLHPNLPGFYLFPADPESNNKRIFVVRSSVRSVKPLRQKPRAGSASGRSTWPGRASRRSPSGPAAS